MLYVSTPLVIGRNVLPEFINSNVFLYKVSQQSQPQLVLTGPQTNATTATMIPTAQGPLLLNQVIIRYN